MIDTNIIEKEYDIKDSQCNFGGGGGGGGWARKGRARAKGLIGAGGGWWAAHISFAIIKGGETRRGRGGESGGVREGPRVSLLIETPGLSV